MIKTKRFYILNNSAYKINIDENINKWLEDNKNIEIIDIKYQTSLSNLTIHDDKIFVSALVIYKEVK